MATAKRSAKFDRLQSLEGAARVDYALRLAQTEKHADLIEAALDVLIAAQHPDTRTLLLAKYAECESGEGRGDPGCHLRAGLLRRLRPLVQRDDRGLLEHALQTYEFLPPGRVEVGANLRAEALVVLNDIDDTLAGYHAVHLLNDRPEHTSQMSGEPAVTAAQVLASQEQPLPLYAYVLRSESGVPEAIGESLRGLTSLPQSLVMFLVKRFGTSRDEIILLGLFDLLLARPATEPFGGVILEFLGTTKLYNLHRYLVSTIVASRRRDLIAPLEALAKSERDPAKKATLDDALALK